MSEIALKNESVAAIGSAISESMQGMVTAKSGKKYKSI